MDDVMKINVDALADELASAANIVTNGGYYEIDTDAVAQCLDKTLAPLFAALTSASAEVEGLRAEVERYKPAWEDMFRHLKWMQGHPALPAHYLGSSLAWVASDLIANAYPEYRDAIRQALAQGGRHDD